MPRLVEPRKRSLSLASASSGNGGSDTLRDYGERVAKYVPAEILAFYTAAVSLIGTADEAASKRLWLFGTVGLFFLIATPLWLGRFTDNRHVKHTNQVMGVFAFTIWAYAFPLGWFKDKDYYDPIIAGLLLIIFSVVSAFVTPKNE
jgi:hypothetical protein